jgi:aminoglycoside phosphotransferase (APT) family kinase protein
MPADIGQDMLQRIWTAYHLGDIRQVEKPEHGVINLCRIVNDTHVIRFDTLDYEGVDRFRVEKMVYERLRDSVPVPDVIEVDSSKTLAPYRYIILSKLKGAVLRDSWQQLSTLQQAQAAHDAGRYLAAIHECTFERFGMLFHLEQNGVAGWNDYIQNRVMNDTDEAQSLHLIDPVRAQTIKSIFADHHFLLHIGTQGRLVHGDYSMDNLLQSDGSLTGVIDFEWALSGDPAWDFRLEGEWDKQCPGSRQHLYRGYTAYQALYPDHELRVRLYQLLQGLDDVLFFGHEQSNAAEYDCVLAQLDAWMDVF